jgi:acetyl-CoA carboxylase carboxyl transferase subunit alpha
MRLDFERPIADLEAKIEELSRLSDTAGPGSFDQELAALKHRVEDLRREAYARLDPWQKTRSPATPSGRTSSTMSRGLIEEFVELRGDRKFADDQADGRRAGPVPRHAGGGHGPREGPRHHHPAEAQLRHGRPEGYRKAVRLMDMAEQFNLPVITFVDTAGAYPGVGAEERGQGRGHRPLHGTGASALQPRRWCDDRGRRRLGRRAGASPRPTAC